MNRLPAFVLAPLALAVLAAAGPSLLAQIEGGMWEVSRAGQAPVRLCAPSPAALLAQFEHRGARCTRDAAANRGDSTVISYSCAGGGFGRSEVTAVTPRSLRVHTQGIADNSPFNYTFQARRVGDC